MDNNAIQNPINTPSPEPTYQTLGRKVFWLFFLQTSPIAFILLIVSAIFFFLSFQPFMTTTIMGNMQIYALWATMATFLLAAVIVLVSYLFAWLTFKNYVFMMAEDSLKIKRGILNKTENAIPYRQIQNVDIERSFMFQTLGLSRLIILTAGHEDETVQKESDEAEGVIPAVDKEIAEWLQTELLKRADIQKTIQVNK